MEDSRSEVPVQTTAPPAQEALLTVRDLHCVYGAGARRVHAVRGVSFDVMPGETLALVGESGCGKTTTGRAMLQLPPPQAGRVEFRGEDMSLWSSRQLRDARSDIQMVFQDALSAFNPRRKVTEIVGEGLRMRRMPQKDRMARVEHALERVGMSMEQTRGRYPHEFSGGQNQRIGIARALALEPSLLVCDEPVASLDVSVQARVLNLLQDIADASQLSMIFISHDLSVVKLISDRVAVMYRGRIVELGPAQAVYESPAHPYTKVLLDAAPTLDDPPPLRSSESAVEEQAWRKVDRALIEISSGHYAAVGDVIDVPTPV